MRGGSESERFSVWSKHTKQSNFALWLSWVAQDTSIFIYSTDREGVEREKHENELSSELSWWILRLKAVNYLIFIHASSSAFYSCWGSRLNDGLDMSTNPPSPRYQQLEENFPNMFSIIKEEKNADIRTYIPKKSAFII